MSSQETLNNVHECIRHLLSAVAGAALYSASHPQVNRLAEAALASLTSALKERPEIALLEVDGELVIDGEPQPFSMVLERFVQVMREHGIGHLKFLAGTPRHEINQLIALLAKQFDPAEAGSTEHIKLGRVEVAEPAAGDADGSESDWVVAGGAGSGAGGGGGATSLADIPARELARLGEVYEAIRHKERLRLSGVAATVSELVDAFHREGESLLLLAALREQDEYTFTHSANVCILALAQARSLGIAGQLLNDIGIAALLHDVGKMFVPEDILRKPERLDDGEAQQMRRHPVLGARYLMKTPGVPRLAAIVAFEHHMRFDQSGYPAVPAGWQQNVASQLVAIADCFDAMRTRRSYQEPRPPAVIANALQMGAGTEFNPLLVRNMLSLLARTNRI